MCSENGYLIIDLCNLKRVIEINEELAFAVIEPGVTQGQLADELKQRNSRLMLDVTGAGPDASIVGNISSGDLGTHLMGTERPIPATTKSCFQAAQLPTVALVKFKEVALETCTLMAGAQISRG